MGLNPWSERARRTVYETKWLRVQEHEVMQPDGSPGTYSFVEIPASVGILAINERNEVALVGQWRYPIGRYTWEMVRGGANAGETDMLEVARRELREEIHFEADTWRDMGHVFTCTGLTTDHQSFFVATQLRPVPQHTDPVEPIDVRWVLLPEAIQMISSGEIVEVCTAAALLRFYFLVMRNDSSASGL